jgi:hypothetical protein
MKQETEQRLLLIGFIAVIFFIARSVFAADYQVAANTSAGESYEISDGYGKYTGRGSDKKQALGHAREACVMQKVIAYENRHGSTPDADTTDDYFDACINRK